MSSLQRLQREFQRHVFAPGPLMSRRIDTTATLGADTRLAIYADGYRLRLVAALRSEFPALAAWLGERGFDRLAHGYVAAHPSRQPNLRWFGDALSRFLARDPAWARRPALAELAALEYAIGLAFDAADTPPLCFEDLAAIPGDAWPELRFALHPSTRRLDLRWNTPKLWKAWATAEPRPAPPEARRHREAQPWLVWRNDFVPQLRRLEADEAWALGTLQRGATFARICAGLCRWAGEVEAPLRAASLLKGWVAEQMIVVHPDGT